MTAAYLALVLGVLIIAAIGLGVLVRTPTNTGWLPGLLARLARIRDTSVDELGRYGGALVVLLAGAAAAVIVSWPFGRMARRFEPHIDVPFLKWTQKRFVQNGSFHHANAVLTKMGNVSEIKLLCLVAAVVFAVLWAKRGFWIPVLVMAGTFGFEKFGQLALKKVVDRGHPPTSLGSYPSGGCARLLTVFGIIFYLALLTWPSISRRWRVTGWTVLGILAFVEGFTRIFLFKHWLTDVLGGWLYGTLMLLALIAAVSCFRAKPSDQSEPIREEALAAR